MGKSLDVVKKRIRVNNFDIDMNTLIEISEAEVDRILKHYLEEYVDRFIDNSYHIELFENENGTGKKTNLYIKHDPEADFEYFTYESCLCDGTSCFIFEQEDRIIRKIICMGTYNKNKISQEELENNFYDYSYEYVIGNFIQSAEYNKSFAPKDKPWLMEKLTMFLPIQFNVYKGDR